MKSESKSGIAVDRSKYRKRGYWLSVLDLAVVIARHRSGLERYRRFPGTGG